MTGADVLDRLIEAMEVFQRMEPGKRQWAKDGPWREIRFASNEIFHRAVDALAMNEPTEAERRAAAMHRPPAPDRAMISAAEEAVNWLGWIDDALDRRIVLMACARLIRDGRVGWPGLVRVMGLNMDAETARTRQLRALEDIAWRLRRGVVVAAVNAAVHNPAEEPLSALSRG